jgi:hypothetical protein
MRPLTNAERQARWRDKRIALAVKGALHEARKPWDLHQARKGMPADMPTRYATGGPPTNTG